MYVGVVDVRNLELTAFGWNQRADLLKDGLVVHIDADHGGVGLWPLRLFFDADDALTANFGNPESFRVFDFLEENSCTPLLAPELLDGVANAAFNDVVAKDDAQLLAVGEVLGQAQRFRDAALAFLIGEVEMRQAEL